jgi:PhnB protein
MARVVTYLNFNRQTEAAFTRYAEVFGSPLGEINRLGAVPASPDHPPLPDADRELVMHVELTILGGHVLMGSDVPSFMPAVVLGTGHFICLEVDARADADRLFAALADGGTVGMPPTDMFWGDYWGTCTDRFGVQWMFSHRTRPTA